MSKLIRSNTWKIFFSLALLMSAFTWGSGTQVQAQGGSGAVYAMTNDAISNQVIVFDRASDGTLSPGTSFPTGGMGSGGFENSANGLVLGSHTRESSPINLGGSDRLLFATNAGSDSISVFRTTNDGLELVDVEPSNGDHPISVTVSKGVLYVLNGGATNCSGGTPTISGFTVSGQGELSPIPGSTRPVSGGANSGCAQVSFNPQGDVLVVTQRQADKIDTYLVDRDGVATGPIVNETTGMGPFGFTFTQRGHLLTTENFGAAPLQGGAASYNVPDNGVLTPNGPTERNGRSDTCWFVVTDNNKYGFTTNFQTGDISSFRVLPNGSLQLLNPIADGGNTGIGASDEAMSGNSKYLYARNALQSSIDVYEVGSDGSLTPVQTVVDPRLGTLAAIGLAAK